MIRSVWAAALSIVISAVGSTSLTSGGSDATCAARNGTILRWIRAAPEDERAALDRWCRGVGPAIRIAALRADEHFAGPFVVASWNTHVGGGNLERFVGDLRAGRLTGGRPVAQFVLLLQETFRAGAAVPAAEDVAWASAELTPAASGAREDIAASLRRIGLEGVYVPSMRNGKPLHTEEDRGNAIAATVPLTDLRAIELPLERQRRVALEAVVHARDGSGADVPITIVDTHFTNMVMHHLWLFSIAGRTRQAQALAAALPADGPLVIGGDFNAWFGLHDAAYRELAKHAAPSPGQDGRATFGPMRLDHVLFRLPPGWKTTVRRAEERYGSDHYPLVATVSPS